LNYIHGVGGGRKICHGRGQQVGVERKEEEEIMKAIEQKMGPRRGGHSLSLQKQKKKRKNRIKEGRGALESNVLGVTEGKTIKTKHRTHECWKIRVPVMKKGRGESRKEKVLTNCRFHKRPQRM